MSTATAADLTTGTEVRRAPSRRRKVTIARSMMFLAGSAFCANVIQSVHEAVAAENLPNWTWYIAVVAFVGAVLAQVLWRPKTLVRWVTHLRFGVASFGVLTLATMMGTFILQGTEPAVFTEEYGSLAPFLHWMHFDDIFHSYAFVWLLSVSAVSQASLVVRRKAWRIKEIGFLGAHGGAVLLLIGGAIGWNYGEKGMAHLMVGNTSGEMQLQDGSGKVALPFQLKLEGFDITRRDPEYRIYILEKNDNDKWMPVAAWAADEEGSHDVEDVGTIEVGKFVAHPEPERRVGPAPDGKGPAGLQVKVGDGGGWMFDDTPQRSIVQLPQAGLTIRFSWDPLPPQEASAAGHHIVVEGQPAVTVKVGEQVTLGGVRYHVAEAMTDFRWNIEEKRAFNASTAPRNPAIALQKVEGDKPSGALRWVFASGMSMGHEPEDGPKLTYTFQPGTQQGWQVTFIGSTNKATIARDGVVQKTGPFGPNTTATVGGVPIVVKELLQFTQVVVVDDPDAPPNNPQVTVRVKGGLQGDREAVLREEGPSYVKLSEGRVLQFAKKSDDIKNFTSTVTLIADGETKTAQVSVNNPLKWGNYMVYQSNYDPANPRYAGLLIVKDPGLDIVYLGLVAIILGVLHILFIRRRRLAKAKRQREVKEVAA